MHHGSEKAQNIRRFLFSNVNVVMVEAGEVMPGMDVFVKDSVIVAIEKHNSSPGKVEREFVVIPGEGKYLVPGLIDSHTHVIFKDELFPYLQYGVTTVFSLGSPVSVLEYRDLVRRGEWDGPNIFAAALIDAIPIDWEGVPFGKSVKSTADVALKMTEIVDEKWDFIKVYNHLSTEEFDEIMRLSKLNVLPVIGHGVRAPGMEHVLAKGVSLVAHVEEFLYTIFKDSLDESKIPYAVSLVRKSGAYVCPNLSTFKTLSDQWGDSLNFVRILNEPGKLKNKLNPVTLNSWTHNNRYIKRTGSISSSYNFLEKLTYALYVAKVPLVAGTDSPIIPGCFPGYSIVKDLQLLADTGIPNKDVLKTATMIPGQYIKQYARQPVSIGLVKAGYQSDLLLLSGNPLLNLEHLREVEGVMVKGRWYNHQAITK